MAFRISGLRFTFLLTVLYSITSCAQTVDRQQYTCQKWRMIGPFRGGRTVGASGNPKTPNVFFIGVNNGGVWKTTDYGRTWVPVFDDQPTGSIGDVAVAPSNPDIVYVGSGEGLQRPDLSVGNGMYRSSDAGKTWKHLGLSGGLQVGGIAIDPKNPDKVFAAVLGHPYGANAERGVFRTTDGGKTWSKVLYTDENTGAIQVTIDPVDPKIVYADMWAARLAPWENGMWSGPASGLYKSTDGGNTWKQLKNGLPGKEEGLGRIGFCIAPSDHNRLYAVVNAKEGHGGVYRSDNAGASWRKMNSDKRLWDRGDDFAEIKADPKNADIVYDANVVVWRSQDGGKTWNGFKGAPGGDDYHRLWINPQHTDVILLASDQGAGITVNGGKTWSSWYNQPTAQLYHVSADNAFPYNVYSGQQESGSVGISSRGNDGAITFRDWHPVGAEEYGYVVADPLDPDIVYGGKISRFNRRTGQTVNISPTLKRSGNYRFLRTAPVVFSPVDNKTLFYAGNVLFKTRDGGNSWLEVSPDLTRTTYDVPECIGVYRTDAMKTMPQRGVIYTIAPSPLDSDIIWAGTDDGLIQLTTNGGKDWKNVTPPALNSWSKISLMDASHTNRLTAYAAVNRIRLDDMHPHIYKTTDGGANWKEIVRGLPDDPINMVKEDPECPGLLFAGSERAVYVSFNDGGDWHPLRMNMPATSIRDLVIKDNDLVVATHGRSFWIMDDINPLRDIARSNAAKKVVLYTPQTAYRVRWNMNTDTPLPQDEPMGENPPDGAIINYYLKSAAHTPVTLDICDASGTIIRHYSSDDTLYDLPPVNIPNYWIRPQELLSAKAGAHRFVWDMHYQPLNEPVTYPMAAIYENTAPTPTGPWAMPGEYTVRLTVNGVSYTQPLTIVMDPRVKTKTRDLRLQFDLSYACYKNRAKAIVAIDEINTVLPQLLHLKTITKSDIKKEIDELFTAVTTLQSGTDNITGIDKTLESIIGNLQQADVHPTNQCMQAVETTNQKCVAALSQWQKLHDYIKSLNKGLKVDGIPPIKFD